MFNDQMCPYCGTKMHVDSVTRYPTRDHIEPLAIGGLDVVTNKIVVCRVCNQDKASRTLRQFYDDLVEADDHRAMFVLRFIRARAQAPVCMSGTALTAEQAARVMRLLASDLKATAASYGLEVAVCTVLVHDQQVRAYTSPFEADSVQSFAVAHQLREQARLICDDAPRTMTALEAAE